MKRLSVFFNPGLLVRIINRRMSFDESKIPDRDTCQKLTEKFAEITQTNEALAQTFLQDHNWNIDESINHFYNALSEELRGAKVRIIDPNLRTSAKSDLKNVNNATDLYNPNTVEKLFGEGKAVTTEPPPDMKLLSWNLDGLDVEKLKRRTRAVIKTIIELEPDIIFFQEVIPESCDYLESKLPEYKCIKGGVTNYFTMTMLRVFTIFYDDHQILDYPETNMGRNLLVTEAHIGKLKFKLLNTHLESTAQETKIRCNQLKFVFDTCQTFSEDYTVIFGGDLNLRDKEAKIPPKFFDLWSYCGSPKEFCYTWDMTRNTNHSCGSKFKPKLRFDRIYIKFNQTEQVKPKHFALTGFQKADGTQSFPSDHWGVVVIFQLNHSL